VTIESLDETTRSALFRCLLRLGDDRLVLGHRLSEWCGHAPILEEDIALANIALDLVGQAEAILRLAGEVEGQGRSEDDLAYLRDEWEFYNLEMLEQPNGDFAFTIMRNFLFDAFSHFYFKKLSVCAFEPLAHIAAKAHKEILYHLRHGTAWVHRLGDGTEESHRRTQNAVNGLWRYTSELFYTDEVDAPLLERNFIPEAAALESAWRELVSREFNTAGLTIPDEPYQATGARVGRHSEHLGHMLAQMQILARSHPGADW
jgi:ring-1,2-phenylacetyl-CoA epoxidase subunit PaaC